MLARLSSTHHCCVSCEVSEAKAAHLALLAQQHGEVVVTWRTARADAQSPLVLLLRLLLLAGSLQLCPMHMCSRLLLIEGRSSDIWLVMGRPCTMITAGSDSHPGQ